MSRGKQPIKQPRKQRVTANKAAEISAQTSAATEITETSAATEITETSAQTSAATTAIIPVAINETLTKQNVSSRNIQNATNMPAKRHKLTDTERSNKLLQKEVEKLRKENDRLKTRNERNVTRMQNEITKWKTKATVKKQPSTTAQKKLTNSTDNNV